MDSGSRGDDRQLLRNAHSEFRKRNMEIAEDLYTRFIASRLHTRAGGAKDLAAAFNNRGQIKYLRVDFDGAVADYTSAIEADGCFEIPLYNRGLVHYRLGFFEGAKNDFRQALEINPDFEDAKVSLQQTLLDQQHKMNRGY